MPKDQVIGSAKSKEQRSKIKGENKIALGIQLLPFSTYEIYYAAATVKIDFRRHFAT